MKSKTRVAYITGVGNNESCIFDILGNEFEPHLFLGTGDGRYRRTSRRHGGLETFDFVLPNRTLLWRLFREGKSLLTEIEKQIGCDLDVVIVDAPFLARWALKLKDHYGIGRVIYMCSDFFPWTDGSISPLQRLFRRFVYHPMDVYCARRADMTWNVSQRIIDERCRYAPDLKGAANIRKYEMSFRPPSLTQHSDEKRILYVGYPRRDHCLEMLLDVMRELKDNKKLDLSLDIIGHSSYVAHLRSYSIAIGLKDRVVFHGTIVPGLELDAVAAKCFMGYALYQSFGQDNYSYFGFPTKLIHYYAMGLPVVFSDLTEFAGLVRGRGIGRIIPVDKDELRVAVEELAANWGEYRTNIEKFVSEQNERASVFFKGSIEGLLS